MWTKLRGAYFKTGGTLLKVDQVLSGEFITLGINNMTNAANNATFWSLLRVEYPDLANKIRVLKTGFTGDDMEQNVRIAGDVMPSTEALTTVEIQRLLNVSAVNAHNNGLLLKELASDVRSLRAEYLKVNLIGGRYWTNAARLHIFASEKQASFADPISLIRAYKSFLATTLVRCGSMNFFERVLIASWLVKRRVLGRVRGVPSGALLPFFALYTPGELGGVGHLPGAIHMPQVDALIAYQSVGGMRVGINRATQMLKSLDTASGRKAAEFVIESGAFDKGIKFIRDNLLPGTIESAESADRELAKKGITKLPFPKYTETPEWLVTRLIADSPKLVELQKEIKLNNISALKTYSTFDFDDNDYLDVAFPWVKYVQLELGDVIPRLTQDSCVIGPDLMGRERIARYGASPLSNEARRSPEQFFRLLRQDREFPSFVRPEQIASYIAHSGIGGDQSTIVQVLMRSGASLNTAVGVAQEIVSNIHTFMYLDDQRGYGASGDFIQMLDLSMRSHDRVVSMPNLTFNMTLATSLKTFAMAYSVSQYPPRFVRLSVLAKDVPALLGPLNPLQGRAAKITPGFMVHSDLRLG
jgi:hypothetical protein